MNLLTLGLVTLLCTLNHAQAQEDCSSAADVAFLVDESGSVGAAQFQKVLQFIHNMVNTSFNVSKDDVRVAMITFGTGSNIQFILRQTTNKASVLKKIDAVAYQGGGTDTHKAIYLARVAHLNPLNPGPGARKEVPQVAIVITDGVSDNPNDTKKEAELAQKQGIEIFAIGIGNSTDYSELQAIASDPDDNHVYSVDDFTALSSIGDRVSRSICKAVEQKLKTSSHSPVVRLTTSGSAIIQSSSLPYTTMISPEESTDCRAAADVAFLVDESGSVKVPQFQKVLQFIHNMVNTSFNVSKDSVRLAMITFGTGYKIQFSLRDTTNKHDVLNKIDAVAYQGGGTDTHKAINLARVAHLNPLKPGPGARKGVPQVAIVITDGVSDNPNETRKEAELAQKQGIEIFAIGIGNSTDYNELQAIASDPDDSHVFSVDDFTALSSIGKTVSKSICTAVGEALKGMHSSLPTRDPRFSFSSEASTVTRSITSPILDPTTETPTEDTLTKKAPTKIPPLPRIGHRGRTFVFSFGENKPSDTSSTLKLSILTVQRNLVTVDVYAPANVLYKRITVRYLSPVEVHIPRSMQLEETEIPSKTVRIQATGAVYVYAMNQASQSLDGFYVIPETSLGRQYLVPSWQGATGRSQIGVSSTKANTVVRISLPPRKQLPVTVTYNNTLYSSGDTITIPVQQYHAVQIQSAHDLSGTMVTANYPVAVNSGNSGTNVYGNHHGDSFHSPSKDHLEDMIPPVTTLGKRFAVSPLQSRTAGYTISILAAFENTTVTISSDHHSTETITLHPQSFIRVNGTSSEHMYVESDAGVLVTQYSLSDRMPSQAFMMTLSPSEQWQSYYVISPPETNQDDSEEINDVYVNIVIERRYSKGLRIDGYHLDSSNIVGAWSPVPNSPYVSAALKITEKVHALYHTSPTVVFSANVYGFTRSGGFGFSAGSRFAPLGQFCRPTGYSLPGDNADNDCDGSIDEEKSNGIDDDDDGLVDEDLAVDIPFGTFNTTSKPNPAAVINNHGIFFLDNASVVTKITFGITVGASFILLLCCLLLFILLYRRRRRKKHTIFVEELNNNQDQITPGPSESDFTMTSKATYKPLSTDTSVPVKTISQGRTVTPDGLEMQDFDGYGSTPPSYSIALKSEVTFTSNRRNRHRQHTQRPSWNYRDSVAANNLMF